jgi:hypothetical protein
MLPLPLFQPVIPGRGAIALRALAAPALVGLDANMNGLRFPSLPQQLDFLINKPGTMLNRVENRFKLELNSWSPLLGGFVFGKFRLNRTVGDQLLAYLFNLPLELSRLTPIRLVVR